LAVDIPALAWRLRPPAAADAGAGVRDLPQQTLIFPEPEVMVTVAHGPKCPAVAPLAAGFVEREDGVGSSR